MPVATSSKRSGARAGRKKRSVKSGAARKGSAKPARAARAGKRPVKARGGAGARIGRDPYAQLLAELREIAVLASVSTTISWDQETCMPEKGADLRAEQLKTLSAMIHERRTSKRFGELLAACEQSRTLKGDAGAQANLRDLRRQYDRATKLPTTLVAELASTFSLGMTAWRDARAKSDFSLFLPWLEKTFELNRAKAKCWGIPAGGRELYDALLDDFEPGMTVAGVSAVFEPLKNGLLPLIERVTKASNRPTERLLRLDTPIEKQKEFCTAVCRAIGFDFEAGRMDESTHPFCEGIGPGDTRMTNRYRADGWLDSLSTAMHESGHGLYEQGLPKRECFGQPLGEYISLGIHESQSRMWENLVGRSRPFWTWAIEVAREIFKPRLEGVDAEEAYRAANLIRPNLIRVESDELTYNLHIMLRFDLERAMLGGELSCADLPGEWNRRIKSDLGLTVPDDRRGCLQDVHWSMGAVGYFPTYTLGNIYASQFWEAMAKDIPDREQQMARGEFGSILAWLRRNIHAHGRRYTAGELCKMVTGAPLSIEPLLRHLSNKARMVYGV